MKKLTLAAIATLTAAFLFTSCTDRNEKPQKPILPPLESIVIGLPNDTATKASSADKTDPYFNFAANTVLANWSFIFNSIIAIPAHGIEIVMSSTPVESGDGEWLWSGTFKEGLNTYTVKLIGQVEKNVTVNWEVRVSCEGILGYEDFAWITGTSDINGEHGTWSVKVNPRQVDVLVNSEWAAKDGQLESVKLTYKLDKIYPGITVGFNDSYVLYERSASSSDYDRSITTHYNHLGLGWWDASIEWNSVSGAGRIICQNEWSNKDWHVWTSSR